MRGLHVYLAYGLLPTAQLTVWFGTAAARRALPPAGCYLALAAAPFATAVLWLVVPDTGTAETGIAMGGVQLALFFNTLTGAMTAVALCVLAVVIGASRELLHTIRTSH